jgi:hypothetical protein
MAARVLSGRWRVCGHKATQRRRRVIPAADAGDKVARGKYVVTTSGHPEDMTLPPAPLPPVN